jgi:hypothetical protein
MGYLNCMGVFDHLASDIEIVQGWPVYSVANYHRGGNSSLVEIARINKDVRDENLPTRLTAALMRSCGDRDDASALEGAAWTIFAELIDNRSAGRGNVDVCPPLQDWRRNRTAFHDLGHGFNDFENVLIVCLD